MALLHDPNETFMEFLQRIPSDAREALPLINKEIRRRDPHFGKRTKSTPGPRFFYNKTGRLWEVHWHYEPYYAKWVSRWLVLLRGMKTNRIRGFQIWWPPVTWKLLWTKPRNQIPPEVKIPTGVKVKVM